MAQKMTNLPLKIVLAAVFCVQAAVLVAWIDYPLLDRHAFRQTHTVLIAYWMLKNANFDLLRYIAPFLGAPWAIPIEFPLYQLFVVAFVKIFPLLELDAAARIVSWSFSIATAYPLYRIVTRYARDAATGLTAACFYLACPFYLFWGRAALIDSTALFFSLMCFWQLICLGDNPSWRFAAFAALFGVCAALVKVTTIPAYMAAGYVHILCIRKRAAVFSRNAVLFCLPGTLSLLAAYAWHSYAEQVRMLNALGSMLTSTDPTMAPWYYGTLQQRLSANTWLALAKRFFDTTLSHPGTIAFVCGIAVFFRRTPKSNKLFAGASIVVFLLPLLVFTNQHYVHTYYQIACVIALLAAFAFLISPDKGGKSRKLHAVVVAGICVLLVCGFIPYHTAITEALERETLVAAEIVRQHTKEDASVIVYGWDWSPEVLYYSQRKGLAVPWLRDKSFVTIESPLHLRYQEINVLDVVKRGMGGLPVNALAVRDLASLPEHDRNAIAAILAAVPVRFEQHHRNVSVYILDPETVPAR